MVKRILNCLTIIMMSSLATATTPEEDQLNNAVTAANTFNNVPPIIVNPNPTPATGANLASLITRITAEADGVPVGTQAGSFSALIQDIGLACGAASSPANPNIFINRLDLLPTLAGVIGSVSAVGAPANSIPTISTVANQVLQVIQKVDEIRTGAATFHQIILAPGQTVPSLAQIIAAIY